MNPSLDEELETGSGMEDAETDSSETIGDVLKKIEKSKKQYEAYQQYTLEFNELMAKYGDLLSEEDISSFNIPQGLNQAPKGSIPDSKAGSMSPTVTVSDS